MDQWRPPELNLRTLADLDYAQYQPKPKPMAIKIDKDVPLPKTLEKRRIIKYPFADLEVGDSFFLEGVSYKAMAPLARYWSRSLKRHFIARSVDGGTRVWRKA